MRIATMILALAFSSSALAETAYWVCPIAAISGWTGPGGLEVDYVVMEIEGAGVDITGIGVIADPHDGLSVVDYRWVHVTATGTPWTFAASNVTSIFAGTNINVYSDGYQLAEIEEIRCPRCGYIDLDFHKTIHDPIVSPQISDQFGQSCDAYENWTDGI